MTPPSNHPIPSSSTTPPKVDSVSLFDITKIQLQDITDIHPCDTASLSDTSQVFDPLKLQLIFSCRHFRKTRHITSAANNSTPVDTIETPTTIGAFATIPKAKEGKSKTPYRHFLENSAWT